MVDPTSEKSRVPLLSRDEARSAGEEASIHPRMAELNIFRALLQHPPVARAIGAMLATLLIDGRLDPRLRELVIMRIGWATSSSYEWAQHWRVAKELKVPEEDLLAVRDWRASGRFGAEEQAVLQATDEILETGTLSEQTWQTCRAQLGGDEELIELVVAIANWHLISQVARSLSIPLEDGLSFWPPDGSGPAVPAKRVADQFSQQA